MTEFVQDLLAFIVLGGISDVCRLAPTIASACNPLVVNAARIQAGPAASNTARAAAHCGGLASQRLTSNATPTF